MVLDSPHQHQWRWKISTVRAMRVVNMRTSSPLFYYNFLINCKYVLWIQKVYFFLCVNVQNSQKLTAGMWNLTPIILSITTCWSCSILLANISKYYYSNKLTNQMQQFHKLVLDVCVLLNRFLAPPHPSSGAYNCSVVGHGPRPTTLLPLRSKVKPETVNAVVSSWWWAWRRPKHVERHTNVR
jgi:hypothetical protein